MKLAHTAESYRCARVLSASPPRLRHSERSLFRAFTCRTSHFISQLALALSQGHSAFTAVRYKTAALLAALHSPSTTTHITLPRCLALLSPAHGIRYSSLWSPTAGHELFPIFTLLAHGVRFAPPWLPIVGHESSTVFPVSCILGLTDLSVSSLPGQVCRMYVAIAVSRYHVSLSSLHRQDLCLISLWLHRDESRPFGCKRAMFASAKLRMSARATR
jgi:hypothetical protein